MDAGNSSAVSFTTRDLMEIIGAKELEVIALRRENARLAAELAAMRDNAGMRESARRGSGCSGVSVG